MKVHQESTPEYVPTDQFYPHTDSVDHPSTLEEAIAYYQGGHDLDKHAEVLAYWGSPDVQADIILDAAKALIDRTMQEKPAQTNEADQQVVVTRYASNIEPLVFYWQRTHQLETQSAKLQSNPSMYINPVLKSLGNLGAKELAIQIPAIITLADMAEESLGSELKTMLTNRARALGLTITEKTVLTVVPPLDQKRVA